MVDRTNIRILTSICDLDIGGSQRVAEQCALGYKRLGYQSGVLTLRGGGPREEKLRKEGIHLFIAESQHDVMDALTGARAWNPDILHVHRVGLEDTETGPIIKEFHSRGAKVIETNIFARPDYSETERYIDLHIIISQWCLWKWTQWTSNFKERAPAVIIPYPVECDPFYREGHETVTDFRRSIGIPEEAFVFGRIGQKWDGKWSPMIFAAFSRFLKKNGDAWLVLVGVPDSYERYLKILRHEVREKTIVLPYLKGDQALRVAYSSMDVFLHAAMIGESFGLVLAEAMLCGCPVVTLGRPTKDNTQIEVVGHQRGGLVVNNLAGMVEAMTLLRYHKETRLAMAQRGRQWVIEHYGSPIVFEMLDKSIGALLSQKSPNDVISCLRSKGLKTNLPGVGPPVPMEGFGRLPWYVPIMAKVVHNPVIYRSYINLRKTQRNLQRFFHNA